MEDMPTVASLRPFTLKKQMLPQTQELISQNSLAEKKLDVGSLTHSAGRSNISQPKDLCMVHHGTRRTG